MYSFQSDYLEGCAPEILEQLILINKNQSVGYGEDEYCDKAREILKRKLETPNVDIHFIPGGTPCNILACSAALKPYEAVIAAKSGHISLHETGAIETTGHKVIEVEGKDGKVLPEEVVEICETYKGEHMVKPAMLFVTNATEYGSVYTLDELYTLKRVCNKYGLYFYLDGARMANALAAVEVNDIKLSDYPKIFDMFYIGGTKNGALLGEAMVIVNDKLKPNFRYLIKQRGQMLAKNRIIGLSFKVLFENDLYLELAAHANKTANALKYVFETYDIEEYVKSSTNQLFVIMDNLVIKKLEKKYGFTVWSKYDNTSSVVRFVTSWATKEEEILNFANDLKAAMDY